MVYSWLTLLNARKTRITAKTEIEATQLAFLPVLLILTITSGKISEREMAKASERI